MHRPIRRMPPTVSPTSWNSGTNSSPLEEGGRVEAWLNLQSNISYDFKLWTSIKKMGHFWKTFCFLCLRSCCSESSNAEIRSGATAAKPQTLTLILRRSLDQLKKKRKKIRLSVKFSCLQHDDICSIAPLKNTLFLASSTIRGAVFFSVNTHKGRRSSFSRPPPSNWVDLE